MPGGATREHAPWRIWFHSRKSSGRFFLCLALFESSVRDLHVVLGETLVGLKVEQREFKAGVPTEASMKSLRSTVLLKTSHSSRQLNSRRSITATSYLCSNRLRSTCCCHVQSISMLIQQMNGVGCCDASTPPRGHDTTNHATKHEHS